MLLSDISMHLSFQVSSHILEIFYAMRKPGTNIQILQQNLLQKHRYMKCKLIWNRWSNFFFLSVQQLPYKVSTSHVQGHKENLIHTLLILWFTHICYTDDILMHNASSFFVFLFRSCHLTLCSTKIILMLQQIFSVFFGVNFMLDNVSNFSIQNILIYCIILLLSVDY